MWIEYVEKKEYKNSAKSEGIRLFFEDIPPKLILEIKSLVKFLRKNYFFPIRCNIHFTNDSYYKSKIDGHIYYGVFFDNQESTKRLVYPKIYVCAKQSKSNSIYEICYTMIHELTHYYQWYFYEDQKRTDRSLEIEANKWARYILYEWKNEVSN